MNYTNKNFILSTTIKKIRNMKYLFFVFNKKTFRNPCIFAIYPIGMEYTPIHGWDIRLIENLQIMSINNAIK